MIRLSLLAILLSAATLRADDWPQWRGPTADGVWHETGIVQKFAEPNLKRLWTAKIGSGYSGPTIADGRVYVTDRLLDPKQVERVHCFDAKSGESLWSHTYDSPYVGVGYPAGPRAAVLIHDGLAYSLGSMGHLFCFDAKSGEVKWSHNCKVEYKIEMPMWGIAAAPVLYGELVVVHIGGSEGACIVAFDRKSGQEKWRALQDRGQYATPVLTKQAGQDVLICWTGDSVAGLAPAEGKVLWRHPWKPKNMPIGVATPVIRDDRVFFTSFYDGSLMLRLLADKPAIEVLWKRVGANENPPNTDALQSIISTPVFEGDHIYGVDSYGELRCLNALTGDRVWESLKAVPKARWSTIHFVKNGDRYFLFNERGDLIIAKLSPAGYEEISRTHLIDPTLDQLRQRGGVCWSHPGYSNKCVFARNDQELVCASLAE